MPPAAILDVDGTLVDSNYHHALAWARAFRDHDLVVPLHVLHRHVGMGGDKYVAAVAGERAEERVGDAVRERWEELFDELLPEVEPLAGARELIEALRERGHRVVLATSAIDAHLDAFLDKLDARELVHAWTTKDDVDASKPDPDLIESALRLAETEDAVLVGDTPWDVAAARRAGIDTICVRSGGFGEAELRDAGALAVYESVAELRKRLDESRFAS